MSERPERQVTVQSADMRDSVPASPAACIFDPPVFAET